MSTLYKEDDDFLYLTEYVHNESDEYPDWLCSEDGKMCPDPRWPQHIVEAEQYALYEIEVKYRIRKSDGLIRYDGVSG